MAAATVECQECSFTRTASKATAHTIATVHHNVTGHRVTLTVKD